MSKNHQLEMEPIATVGSQAEETTPKRKKNGGGSNANPSVPNLGKALKLAVPDFGNPERPLTCLEVDFPIVPINALSQLEGNAGKPIYQMSKWWARRRSSVFRSLLIAAGAQAPDDPTLAGKLVWDAYYANHQKAGNFEGLKVLDPFMGGATTLVEGARLGFDVDGVDLNPVAWFVAKNELACTDPAAVRELFEHVEREVKPQVMPFYATTCPRGHRGTWTDTRSGKPAPEDFDPAPLPPEERAHYSYEGAEVIYTFWAKHGTCTKSDCDHRTPVFSSPVIAEKSLSVEYLCLRCPQCGSQFHAEAGDVRMAPAAPQVVTSGEPRFTALSAEFCRVLGEYGKGKALEKRLTAERLLAVAQGERGLHCPDCGAFAGAAFMDALANQVRAKAGDIKKKALGFAKATVQMTLLIHPDWVKGCPGNDDVGLLGGSADSPVEATARWYAARRGNLQVVEVRGELPTTVHDPLHESVMISTRHGTAVRKFHPEKQTETNVDSSFTCAACGNPNDFLEAVKPTGTTAPAFPHVLQGYCPECDADGQPYNGRFFKIPDTEDLQRIAMAEREWAKRSEQDLACCFPREPLPYAWMTHHLNGGIPNWGYTHWWKMFNARQLLIHAQLLRTIMAAPETFDLEVREQALGAFQQYLRNQNMFVFWNLQGDKVEPMFANANYHPKQGTVENNVFGELGRGNWLTATGTVIEGLEWTREPWEKVVADGNSVTKSEKETPGDPLTSLPVNLYCQSSSDLPQLEHASFDLVITDPPFGDNIFYADLADFFYVWLKIALRDWYPDIFDLPYTNKSQECIRNKAEHPDDPDGFYEMSLTACWQEAHRVLKPGGLIAFTFHHDRDEAWEGVLRSLFEAGFVLVATYPIRSDETKGEDASFGSRKVEYDIIHVCRKRLEEPKPVSWAKMRRWVKDEMERLTTLIELHRREELSEADIRVMLRGKALEFYSRHYGRVYTGQDEPLPIRDALLGINQILDDEQHPEAKHPPEDAEPLTRLYLQIFSTRSEIPRDELHKTLHGTTRTQKELEDERGWVQETDKVVYRASIPVRFERFRQRPRKEMKTDLDHAHFLIGAAIPGSGVNIAEELQREGFALKKSVGGILGWYAETESDETLRAAANLASQLVAQWRADQEAKRPREEQLAMEL